MTKREISIPKVIVGLAVVMLISAAGSGAETPMRLTEVAVSAINGATYVMVTTGSTAKYHAKLVDPRRLVIDFEDTRYQWRTAPFAGSGDPVEEIRGSQFKKDVARLVVQLSRPMRYAIERDASGIVIVFEARAAGGGQPAPAAAPKAIADPMLAAAPVADATQASTVVANAAPLSKSPVSALASVPVRLAQAQAPTPPTAPPAGAVSVTNGRRLISLDFKDADVVNLLRILAAESGRNIVVGDDVKGKMSISLRNVPWEQALDTILEARNLQKIETGNVLRIVTTEQLTREREGQARVLEAKVKSESEARARLAEAQLK